MNSASWLDEVRQPGGYKRLLLVFNNDIVLAAHRLACVKCVSQSLGEVPTEAELYAAMIEINKGLGYTQIPCSKTALAMMAREEGLALL